MKFKQQVIRGLLMLTVMLVSVSVQANGTPVEEVDCQNAGYEKGFYVKTCDDNFKMTVNLQLQPQYQALILNGANNNVHSFQLRRGRLIFGGHVFNPNLTFKFQYEAVGGRDSMTREGEVRGNTLRDAYISYKFNDYAVITAGQTKALYNREELTSSSKLQFVGRSIVNEVFNLGRDLGLWLQGAAFKGHLEYGLFVSNEGNAQNTSNFNTELLMGARADWNVFGRPHDYTMSDVKHSQDVVMTVGLAANFNRPAGSGDDTHIASTADVALMYRGFSFLGAGLYARNTSDKLNILGFLGQAGYFIVPKKFEVAGRFGGVVPTAAGVVNGWEFGGGLNYLFKGHNLKLQTDYFYLKNSALAFGGAAAAGNITGNFFAGFTAGANDHRLRTQLSAYF